MFSKVYSGGLMGIDGYLVQVESDASEGLPSFTMVGYLGSEVREAEQRVRTAIRNSGFHLAAKKITVNLSPAHVRKEGTAYDLPVAVTILASYGLINRKMLENSAFIGELGLDGSCKPVRGVLPLVMTLRESGILRCFLAPGNVQEGLAVDGMEIIRVDHLKQLTDLLNHPDEIQAELQQEPAKDAEQKDQEVPDFDEVHGQFLAKRATEIAAAGMHNILYIGPPGSGKSMIARRIPTILPSLERGEQLEVAKIYSICGMLPADQPLPRIRPYRAPHHTISSQALVGGGKIPKPGEVSLASRGVLFLDELPEFQKNTLEILRQPLEDRKITISRLHGSCDFPAHFILAAAMNPCPCGFYPDRNRCSCNEWQIRRYLERISGPLLDRIDLCVEAASIEFQDLRSQEKGESSEMIRKRVEKARLIQRERFQDTGIFFNGEMKAPEIERYCSLQPEDELFLQQTFQNMNLSARGMYRILRVARTIADLDGRVEIGREHLCEAIGYRSLEGKYWKAHNGS